MSSYKSNISSSANPSPTSPIPHETTSLPNIDGTITSQTIHQSPETKTLSGSYISGHITNQGGETPLVSSNISDISGGLGHQGINLSSTQPTTNSISSSPSTSTILIGGSGTVNQQFSNNYEYQYKQQPMLPHRGQGNPYFTQQHYAPPPPNAHVPGAVPVPVAQGPSPASAPVPIASQKTGQTSTVAPHPVQHINQAHMMTDPQQSQSQPLSTSHLMQIHQPVNTAQIPPSNGIVPNSAIASQNAVQSSRFTPQEIQTLKQLLGTGEKFKWKQITKEINIIASKRNEVEQAKNISPTFVIKQYQSLLGLPNNQMYFGTLGSSLPYVVHGWDAINDVD